MKRYKSLIVLLVAATLLLAPFSAFASVREGSGEASLLQEGEYSVKALSDRGQALLGATNVEDYIYAQLKAVSSSFSLYSYNININDLSALISDVINDNPDLFYVSSSFSYTFYYNGRTSEVTPQYVMTSAEIEANSVIFEYGVDCALSIVDSSMNDLQKATVIHDYICDLATYPQLSSGTVFDQNGYPVDDLDEDIYHSAFGFFYDQNIVCAGYSLTYSYLMNQLGVDCEYVSSDEMGHAWNKIKIDGSWYNADLTFDDFDYEQYQNTRGSVQHCFFLKSDSYFQSLSGYFHYGGATFDTCNSTSTLYDDAFFNDVNSMIYVVNGDFYYLDPDFTNGWVYLVKRTQQGTEQNIGYKLPATYITFEPGIYDKDGNSYDAPYSDLLARLTYLDGRFYVAANTKLYSMKLDGTRKVIKPQLEYYVVGLGTTPPGQEVSDGNINYRNVIYNIYGDVDDYELDKVEYFHDYLSTNQNSSYNNYPDIDYNGYINAKDYAMMGV